MKRKKEFGYGWDGNGQIDCVNKQSLLLDVVQALTDLNLTISKGYISCDAGCFLDGMYVCILLSL